MKSLLNGRLLSVTCLVAALVPAPGCGNTRPEGDLPEPRTATREEMEASDKLSQENLRKAVQAGDLTTSKRAR